jgi:hypothetical protein
MFHCHNKLQWVHYLHHNQSAHSEIPFTLRPKNSRKIKRQCVTWRSALSLVHSDVRTSCELHCQGSDISPIIMIRRAMLNSKSREKHSSKHSHFFHEKIKRRNVCTPKHRDALESLHPWDSSQLLIRTAQYTEITALIAARIFIHIL